MNNPVLNPEQVDFPTTLITHVTCKIPMSSLKGKCQVCQGAILLYHWVADSLRNDVWKFGEIPIIHRLVMGDQGPPFPPLRDSKTARKWMLRRPRPLWSVMREDSRETGTGWCWWRDSSSRAMHLFSCRSRRLWQATGIPLSVRMAHNCGHSSITRGARAFKFSGLIL